MAYGDAYGNTNKSTRAEKIEAKYKGYQKKMLPVIHLVYKSYVM